VLITLVHAGLGDRHGRGELRYFAAGLRSNQEPHVRDNYQGR